MMSLILRHNTRQTRRFSVYWSVWSPHLLSGGRRQQSSTEGVSLV